MASNPPFLMEDQTDEDFFDKLVNDDDDFKVPPLSSAVHNFADSSDSDEVKAFANLSIGEVPTGLDVKPVETGGVEAKSVDADRVFESSDAESLLVQDPLAEERTSSLISSNSSGSEGVMHSNNGSIGAEVNSAVSKSSGSSSAGVKEVQWSAFSSDLTQNGNNGFESYSDVFGEFGNGTSKSSMNDHSDWNCDPGITSSIEARTSLDLGNSYSYVQNQDVPYYDTTKQQLNDGQDLNSSQYWENLYPGWKYDPATGQWCQLDGYDPASDGQGGVHSNSASDLGVSDGKMELHYFQQAAESVVGTVAEVGSNEKVAHLNQVSELATPESISNWSSASQDNIEYPSHMVLDPQYPGWYYDTIAQEWRTLESYYSSGHVQQKQAEGDSFSRELSHETDQETCSEFAHGTNHTSKGFSPHSQDYNWAGSFVDNSKQGSNVLWPQATVSKSETISKSIGRQPVDNHYHSGFALNDNVSRHSIGSQPLENLYQSNFPSNNGVYQQSIGGQPLENHHHSTFPSNYSVSQQIPHNYEPFYEVSQGQKDFSRTAGAQSFSAGNFSQQFNQARIEQMEHINVSNRLYASQNSMSFSQQSFQNGHQFSSQASHAGQSTAGRPPHALVTFGFGGKLIIMKGNTGYNSSSYGSQDATSSISVLNLAEVINTKGDVSSPEGSGGDYVRTLCQSSFPGPLTGGNVGMKELNKWIDERIAQCEAPDLDYAKAKLLRLLLSLLKIACQHYGKLRSPYSSDAISMESDGPELAVARLFASDGRKNSQFNGYAAVANCLQNMPTEAQMQATASEVQALLVSGKKKEALLFAQEGQLWGPALILAAQLGDQFYVDTVKQMSLRQLVAGSPLRTLCLLIAGQPAEVFSADMPVMSRMSSTSSMSQQSAQLSSNSMLDDWEENLAVIAANRTKDDELVLIHLGDCLWKERSEIIAAHICYLVAEANFEHYSDSARFCLVGSDHWKFPRTYANPKAIQRTEIYEYSKVLGNSQFILLHFQPYRLLYAYMLAEVGKLSDSLRYCQAVLKALKTGRSPEVETWKQLVVSLEERIRTHQQGGFSSNLAPAKLVGKLLNLFDSTAHRVVGGLPPPAPSLSIGNVQVSEHYQQSSGLRVSSSQSTMAISSLMPSTSTEPVSAWTTDGNKMTSYGRSVSEPDFGRTPRQNQVDSTKGVVTSTTTQGKLSGGTSRFGRFGFGTQLFQKTVGLVLKPRQDRQAKLGETNKFYYDEKLKRWVEEGAELPSEEAALPPPPITSGAFQNGTTDYSLKNALTSDATVSNGVSDIRGPISSEYGSGIPPTPPTSNQFSARARLGVRSRYVDTFNKGVGNTTAFFNSPPTSSVNASVSGSPSFFVPTPASASVEQPANTFSDTTQYANVTEESHSTPMVGDLSKPFAPSSQNRLTPMVGDLPKPFAPSPALTMQRFASMDNLPNNGAAIKINGSFSTPSRRVASWSGSLPNGTSPPSGPEGGELLGDVIGIPSQSFTANNSPLTHPSIDSGLRDELQEVEL